MAYSLVLVRMPHPHLAEFVRPSSEILQICSRELFGFVSFVSFLERGHRNDDRKRRSRYKDGGGNRDRERE